MSGVSTASAISMGLMAASAAATTAGSISASNASAARTGAINGGRNALTQQEINRQDALSAEAWPIFNQNMESRGADASKARLGEAVASRNAVTGTPLTSKMSVGGAPPAVNNEIKRQTSNIGDVVARTAEGKNKLEGYSDVAAGDSVSAVRAGTKLGNISGFSRGSAGVLPAEFSSNDYNAVRDNQDPWGPLLKALGGAFGLAGAYSGGAGGVSGTGPTGQSFANELSQGYRPV